MQIIRNIDQGSLEWLDMRLGSIGGSGVKKATAGGNGKTRTDYMYKKAHEILSGKIAESYTNDAMRLGTDSESLSRKNYEILYDTAVDKIAMVKESEHKHCSPDGLVGDDGMIEIKNTNGKNFIEIVHRDRVPPEHVKQIQWGLKIADRQWCDFVQACWVRDEYNEIVAQYPVFPIFVKRVERDEDFIKELSAGVDKFIEEMLLVVEDVKLKIN